MLLLKVPVYCNLTEIPVCTCMIWREPGNLWSSVILPKIILKCLRLALNGPLRKRVHLEPSSPSCICRLSTLPHTCLTDTLPLRSIPGPLLLKNLRVFISPYFFPCFFPPGPLLRIKLRTLTCFANKWHLKHSFKTKEKPLQAIIPLNSLWPEVQPPKYIKQSYSNWSRVMGSRTQEPGPFLTPNAPQGPQGTPETVSTLMSQGSLCSSVSYTSSGMYNYENCKSIPWLVTQRCPGEV